MVWVFFLHLGREHVRQMFQEIVYPRLLPLRPCARASRQQTADERNRPAHRVQGEARSPATFTSFRQIAGRFAIAHRLPSVRDAEATPFVPRVLGVDLRLPVSDRLLNRLLELRLVALIFGAKRLQVSLDHFLGLLDFAVGPLVVHDADCHALRPIVARLNSTVIDDGATRNVAACRCWPRLLMMR